MLKDELDNYTAITSVVMAAALTAYDALDRIAAAAPVDADEVVAIARDARAEINALLGMGPPAP